MRRIALFLLLTCSLAACAQDGWMERVARTQAEQPHWITPLATTTPRLEQEFRFDMQWLQTATGTTTNYGVSKGLELIPAERVEVILGVPAYLAHTQPGAVDGWSDWSWLVKYRLLSRNEEHGGAIITAFLGGTFPTGSDRVGAPHPTLTPTIAYGKGFGNFDLQGTFGVTFPTADASLLGTPVSWNNAFQYRVLKKLWPEVEINSTFFHDGPNSGRKQVFITPGLVIGKIPLHNRLGLTLGAGVQIAATHFHTSNHNAILSLRLPF
ncbi:MAG TPA: hypothetical protein VFU76_05110 [Terriglobales bacterium]|nr:hypothetical protein [Terriglobales bacterium]